MLGWQSHAIDLRGHGSGPDADLSVTTMRDYADDVATAAQRLDPKPIVMGWSMGGLVALMLAARGLATACVGLAPSAPSRALDDAVPLRTGVFDSREYGIVSLDASHQPEMPDLDSEERSIALRSLGVESRLARDERKRGIVLEDLSCRLLIVTAEWEGDRQQVDYAGLRLSADYLSVAACSHWGLVLNRRALRQVVPAVDRWMSRAIPRVTESL